ncbi:hypothetical protein CUU64_09725 [Bacillus sp. V5-8f]|nr:hypothetical protein CUU64_09725 [Bacillus sp. V5-8f]
MKETLEDLLTIGFIEAQRLYLKSKIVKTNTMMEDLLCKNRSNHRRRTEKRDFVSNNWNRDTRRLEAFLKIHIHAPNQQSIIKSGDGMALPFLLLRFLSLLLLH